MTYETTITRLQWKRWAFGVAVSRTTTYWQNWVALANARRIDRAITLDFIDAMLREPADFEVYWVTAADHQEAVALLRDRADKQYSLCDAVSFLLMRRLGIVNALTTDHHFEQEGFVRVLKP